MNRLPCLVFLCALLAIGVLLGGSLYDTLVLAPNLHGGAERLEHGRLFLVAATPAHFFRGIAPTSQLLALATLIACWRRRGLRARLLAAVIALAVGDVVTFAYHYPRNAELFTAPLTVAPERLAAVAREWQLANYLRVALVATAWLALATSLTRLLRDGQPQRSAAS
jgi:hypothetical protein